MKFERTIKTGFFMLSIIDKICYDEKTLEEKFFSKNVEKYVSKNRNFRLI